MWWDASNAHLETGPHLPQNRNQCLLPQRWGLQSVIWLSPLLSFFPGFRLHDHLHCCKTLVIRDLRLEKQSFLKKAKLFFMGKRTQNIFWFLFCFFAKSMTHVNGPKKDSVSTSWESELEDVCWFLLQWKLQGRSPSASIHKTDLLLSCVPHTFGWGNAEKTGPYTFQILTRVFVHKLQVPGALAVWRSCPIFQNAPCVTCTPTSKGERKAVCRTKNCPEKKKKKYFHFKYMCTMKRNTLQTEHDNWPAQKLQKKNVFLFLLFYQLRWINCTLVAIW